MHAFVQTLLALQLAVLVGATALLLRRGSRRNAAVVTALVLLVTAAWAVERGRGSSAHRRSAAELAESAPAVGRADAGFVSSATCRACHPAEYASWHASFHRTMTQAATPAAVAGDFDGVTLRSRGREYHLERRGEEFWAELVDPDWERDLRLAGQDPDRIPDAPRVRRRIVMTTGSHHMQTYWVPSVHAREVYNLPFVYLFERDRWVPREDVFMVPPGSTRFFALWNNSCIDCHSTAGKVGFDFASEEFDSSVAELGIACEACHGPAAAHVAANRSPLRRYGLHLGEAADATIVQPARLPHDRASEVCGQCHGVTLGDDLAWLEAGHVYRAGDTLADSRVLVRPAARPRPEPIRELLERDPRALDSRFWRDGLVRVSGREFSGMAESACYTQGELSCLSCHSMHNSDPDDQLARGLEGDAPCLTCHAEVGDRVAEHTHHDPGSSGSRCQNCHMPHTTYGLLKAIRSHTVDSPSVAADLDTGRPNACNLCHLDRTLAWTADRLTAWYGTAPVALTDDERSTAASVLRLLTGDAGQRAIVAWNMGWEPARQASGRGWLAPYLAHLLNDPYAVVRYVAERSLRDLPGYGDLTYDYLDPPERRVQALDRTLEIWFSLPVEQLERTGNAVLIDASGNLQQQRIIDLARRRDDTPMFLAE